LLIFECECEGKTKIIKQIAQSKEKGEKIITYKEK